MSKLARLRLKLFVYFRSVWNLFLAAPEPAFVFFMRPQTSDFVWRFFQFNFVSRHHTDCQHRNWNHTRSVGNVCFSSSNWKCASLSTAFMNYSSGLIHKSRTRKSMRASFHLRIHSFNFTFGSFYKLSRRAQRWDVRMDLLKALRPKLSSPFDFMGADEEARRVNFIPFYLRINHEIYCRVKEHSENDLDPIDFLPPN